MNEYSIWPAALCMLLLWLVVSSPALNAADTPPSATGPRISTLDGLRGFSALAVFFHHAAIFHNYWLTGSWQPPPSKFYAQLGPVGVGMFFMTTGYLFWGKTIKDRGNTDWVSLYAGRLFRIGALYWCAMVWMLALVAIHTHFRLQEPAVHVSKEIGQWLALGVYWPHNVNGFAGTNQLMAGVTWSLQYEWFFYISLLVTAFVPKAGLNDLVFAGGGFAGLTAYLLINGPETQATPVLVCIDLFLAGMTCASLRRHNLMVSLPNWVSSMIALGCVVALVRQFDGNNGGLRCLLMGISFFLIVSGSTLFGLLTTRAARRLGDVSYGIYLLQGLVLTCVVALPGVRRFALSSPLGHWTTIATSGLCLIAVATLAHMAVERPGIAIGKIATRRLKEFFWPSAEQGWSRVI